MSARPPYTLPILWHGVDGSVWDLLDRRSPVGITSELVGVGLPRSTPRWQRSAQVAGGTHRGSVVDERTVSFNLLVGDTRPPYRTGADWHALDTAWWASLDTERLGTLQIGPRMLRCRLGDVEDAFTQDPSLRGRAVYSVELLADEPYWELPVQRRELVYRASRAADYYGGEAGVGPPYIISMPQAFTDPWIDNDGDLPAYARYRVHQAAGDVEVGVAGARLVVPFGLADGDDVLIDTDPAVESITDADGLSLWPRMGHRRAEMSHEVAPGRRVPIVINAAEKLPGFTVTVEITPRCRRAW